MTANLERASEIGARIPPNTQPKYSNMGYQLLGEIVARVSGRPYAEYVREQILDPLGMSGSGFPPLPEAKCGRMATGYTVRQFSDELSESVAAPDNHAEGGLISCVADLARWISFQVRKDGGERSGAQVLAESTLAEMHRPRYLSGDPAWELAWGISWYAIRRDDVVWVQHSGDIHGFSSNVCFDREHRVGAIVLVNTMVSAGELSMQLAAIGREAVAALPAPIAPPQPMPEAYRDLLGYYGGDNFSQLVRLEWRDGRLTFVDPTMASWRPTLTATDSRMRSWSTPTCGRRASPACFTGAPTAAWIRSPSVRPCFGGSTQSTSPPPRRGARPAAGGPARAAWPCRPAPGG